MKKLILGLITVLTVTLSFGQQIEKLDYCNCTDEVDQITQTLNGKYERRCNGVLVETGQFINGLKDGEWKSFSKKGTLIRKINYNNGLLNGTVELFYAGGKPKLTAEFSEGNKIGQWIYYTSNGKVLAKGGYDSNMPTGIWTIKDKKGKKDVLVYDYSKKEYLKDRSVQLHEAGDILQNENTEEWYILLYPDRPKILSTAPIGGYSFASDLFVDLVEVPLDYWDTYYNIKYKATFLVKEDNGTTFQLKEIDSHMPDNTPILPFVIITNDDNKIKNVKHSDLSKKLLEFKINEALSFLPPWIYKDKNEIEVYVPYDINKVKK